MNPILQTDGYKLGHKFMYPKGTSFVFSNLTPRGTRRPSSEGITWFGLQYFIKEYLIKQWNQNFFEKPKEEVVKAYFRRLKAYLGPDPEVAHIEALHDLGYLPLAIRSLPEGSLVPYRVAPMVIFSTHEDFSWLVNYLETIISTTLWLPSTSATTTRIFRQNINRWAEKTTDNLGITDWMLHDFSMRGMGGLEGARLSGAAHLIFSKGTDTVPAIDFIEEYYNADCEKELIAMSVPASEHAVASLQILKDEQDGISIKDGDYNYISNLMDVFPTGILSLVSDTFDYWATITETLPRLKDKILARDGKVVIRPDSGDPTRVVCGYKGYDLNGETEHGISINLLKEQGFEMVKSEGIWYEIVPGPRQDSDYELKATKLSDAEVKGSVQCLWDIFGGTVNSKGFKELDPHIGLIYGDSITIERAEKICQGLYDKGFAVTNLVYGVGSFTYQLVTRDTDGWAIKATAAIVGGKIVEIYKDPKTDNGVKKSARGFLAVYKDENGKYYQKDQVYFTDVLNCDFELVFQDGKLYRDHTFSEIRERAAATIS